VQKAEGEGGGVKKLRKNREQREGRGGTQFKKGSAISSIRKEDQRVSRGPTRGGELGFE